MILFQINNELNLDAKDDEIKCLQAFSKVRDQLLSDLAVNHNINFHTENGSDDDIYHYIQPSIRTTATNKKSTLEFFFFEVFNVNMNLIDILLINIYLMKKHFNIQYLQ